MYSDPFSSIIILKGNIYAYQRGEIVLTFAAPSLGSSVTGTVRVETANRVFQGAFQGTVRGR